jgi:uncharacterized phage protein (TIGR02220 family)
MNAQEFLRKFSTKKDALTAIDIAISIAQALDSIAPIGGNEKKWLKLKKDIENVKSKFDMADQVLELFNNVNGSAYRNNEKIKAIIRNDPKVTYEQFASVIYHKKETWGNDPKMREYLRPATLFGSLNKFHNYLDDATNYWIKKTKTDS